MKSNKFAPKKNAAQAIVEFAIVLPLLLLLLYGLLEAGRLLFVYSSIVTASRQAARYGATTGQGGNWTSEGGPNNSTVPRYQDCYGIRRAAQRADFLNAFSNADIDVQFDNGSNPPFTGSCNTDPGAFTPPDNNSRIFVTVTGHFTSLVPRIVPFFNRTIEAQSARTILKSVTIQVAGGGSGAATTEVIVQSTPNPSEPGEPVTVTVTVNNLNGTTTPTGKVLITTPGGGSCMVTLSGGMGTCPLKFLFYSDTWITADYTPTDSTKFDPQTGQELHQIKDSSTITTVTVSPEPSIKGNSVTIFVSVTNKYAGNVPSGTVTVSTIAGGCTINLNSNGKGSCNGITFNVLGWSNVTAGYNGDADHLTSSGTTPHEVLLTDPTPGNTPAPPTKVPPTPIPVTTVAPTPVSGCNSIANAIKNTKDPIKLSGSTMYLDIPNTNNYPITISSVYVAWNYDKGHVPGDSRLNLLSADVNGTQFWTGDLNQPSALLPASTAVVIPANRTSTLTFTFNQKYSKASGSEQIQITFSTPGCEAYPVIVPSGLPTITPVPSGNLKVQLISAGSDNIQETQFRQKVINTGAGPAANIAVRIYFTLDGSNAATDYVLDHYDISGASTISGPTLASGNTYYFTIDYGAASLPGGGEWELHAGLHLSSYAATFDSANDWWHTGSALPQTYTDWPTVPAYENGSLVWGSQP